jgi:Na+-driven multidrug efflux pump
MLFLAVIGVVYLIAAPVFIRIFTQAPEAVYSGSLALRVMALGYVFYGYGMILSQAINGAGDTRTPTILNFICFWLIEMPLAWLLALYLDWGQVGVYISIVAAESMLALGAMWIFRRGKWKLVKV